MRPLSLEQVAQWTGGTLRGADPAALVKRVSTDSRKPLEGALFIALIGERFDAHHFVGQAFTQGAAAALVSQAADPPPGPLVVVADTRLALQQLASRYRASLSPFVCVAITGSNGKTSTKDFLASVLTAKFKVHATRGNLNNDIGVPLTLLAAGPEHTAGVIELGINHPDELAPLIAIAQPDIGLITNIGTAHIEFFGTRDAIGREKGRLAEAIDPAGHVVLNADDDLTPAIAARTRATVLTAGLAAGDVRAENIHGRSFDLVSDRFALPPASCRVTLPVPGQHMIQNAVLAAAAGLLLGVPAPDVRHGLENARVHGGRLERRTVGGLTFLDDSYNANPDSMEAALRTLTQQPVPGGRHFAVLGRMAELGPHSPAGHRAVGRAAAREQIDFLLTVGDDDARLIHDAFGDGQRSRHFASHEGAAMWLREHATVNDLILIKGSRSAAMENVIRLVESGPALPAGH